MNKFQFYPEAYSEALDQHSALNAFFNAAYEAGPQNPLNSLKGIRQFSGFLDVSNSTGRRLTRSKSVVGYPIGGTYYYLLHEIMERINTNEHLFQIVWRSYKDPDHDLDEMIIHWRKFNYPGRVIVLFTYLRWTSFLSLPPEMWRKNSKIIKLMIKAINEQNKISPFIKNN